MVRKILNKPRAIEYPVFADDRGVFAPVVNGLNKIEPKAGQAKRIYYCVNDTKGIVRGFHYHKKEWKFFVIVQGSAKFVALNPENPEEKYQFISSARKNNLISVPPGFANGWVSLSDNTILLCVSTSTTEESIKDDKRYDPYEWGDVWAVKAR
ncbi:MAG: dTDP-4-dehydrorhamnose 3,5-epimerase family protein [Patescibacteria group bacterium]